MKRLVIAILLIGMLILPGCGSEIPENPDGLTVYADGAISLFWKSAPKADFYRIYRIRDGIEDYRFIDDTFDTVYTDTTAEPGRVYRYKVAAIAGSDESTGAVSERVSLDISISEELSKPDTPEILSVTRMNKYMTAIAVKASDGNGVFEIMRSSTADGEYETIGTTAQGVFYDDTAAGTEYYKAAQTNAGNERAESAPKATGENAGKVFGVPVIMYHDFVTQRDLDNGIEFDEYAVWKDEFEEDLIWLRDNGYNTITTKQLADCIEGVGELPENPILLTADDGKLGVYKNAYPLLKKYGMTLSLSLIGNEIDYTTEHLQSRPKSTAPFCSWDEIAEMAASGAVEMISHTQTMHAHSHDNRTGANCAENESLEDFLLSAQEDFLAFNSKLKMYTGSATSAMAYPYSVRSETSDLAWLKSGYKILLCGNDSSLRKSSLNYFVMGAGVSRESAAMKRFARMTGTPLSECVYEAVKHDSQ